MVRDQKWAQFSAYALSQAATSATLSGCWPQTRYECCILFHQNSCQLSWKQHSKFSLKTDICTNNTSKSIRSKLWKIYPTNINCSISWYISTYICIVTLCHLIDCLTTHGVEGKHTDISQCSASSWLVLVRKSSRHERVNSKTHLWTMSLLSQRLIFLWYFDQGGL